MSKTPKLEIEEAATLNLALLQLLKAGGDGGGSVLILCCWDSALIFALAFFQDFSQSYRRLFN